MFLRRMILLILAGGGITLLIAWAAALGSTPQIVAWGNRVDVEPWNAFVHETATAHERYHQSRSGGIWPTPTNWKQMRASAAPWWAPTLDEPNGSPRCVGTVATGWPMRCMVAYCEYTDPRQPGTASPTYAAIWTRAWRIKRPAAGILPMPDDRVLPLGVLALPMMGNIVFWATAISVIWMAMRLGQAIVRRRRGRCLTCGYPVVPGGSNACPECGQVTSLSIRNALVHRIRS